MPTFNDIGLPFPLFEADVSSADTDPAGECTICAAQATLRFSGACYQCFREWRVENAVGTELGMVRLEDARAGRTHGLPLTNPGDLLGYELVPHDADPRFPEERWYSVIIPPAHLLELVRTPRYTSWQGERWLFCCGQPAVFTGTLPPLTSSEKVGEILGVSLAEAQEMATALDDGSISTYLFRCQICRRERGHYDVD
jgi:uncharacterized protein CbrC (UPF0167 family)